MTQTAAVGDGPVVFFTKAGQQVSIPLSAIYFEGGAVKTTLTGLDDLDAWLKHLVKQGRLAPKPIDFAGDAMIVTAAEDGTAGNRITVLVEATSDKTKVDVTVTSIDVYEGLTLASLQATLGTSTVNGSRPGLVRLRPGATADPIEHAADPSSPQGTVPSWEAQSATTTPAFIVEARRPNTDPAAVAVVITKVEGVASAKTFTLTATWSVKVRGVTATTVPALVTAVAFAVVIDPPTGGGGYKLPRVGTVTLGGGAEAALAKKATATILAS
jgi:hypothetical protein